MEGPVGAPADRRMVRRARCGATIRVSRPDFEKGRERLQAFAAQRGLEYKDVDVREAIQLIYRRTKAGRAPR